MTYPHNVLLTIRSQRIRLLVNTSTGCRRLAQVWWDKKDASVYVMPEGHADAESYAGVEEVREGPHTFDYSRQGVGRKPYVSLHESGHTHVQFQSGSAYRSPDLKAPRFDSSRSGHLATIDCFLPELALPLYSKTIKPPPGSDMLLGAPGQAVERARVVINVGGRAEESSSSRFWVQLAPAKSSEVLNFSFEVSSARVTPVDGPCNLVIGGWGTDAVDRDTIQFVFALVRPRA